MATLTIGDLSRLLALLYDTETSEEAPRLTESGTLPGDLDHTRLLINSCVVHEYALGVSSGSAATEWITDPSHSELEMTPPLELGIKNLLADLHARLKRFGMAEEYDFHPVLKLKTLVHELCIKAGMI